MSETECHWTKAEQREAREGKAEKARQGREGKARKAREGAFKLEEEGINALRLKAKGP